MPDTPSLTQSHGDGFRLLVVDDDIDIRDLLADYLRKHGFTVESAADGAEMRRKLTQNSFDLLVLDIMMPGEDGLSLCRELRAKSRDANEPDTPVIFLTALGEATDRVVGLELGADDYVVKPFSPKELMMRVAAILKRSSSQTDTRETVEIGELKVDFTARRVTLGDRVLELSPKEYDLLFYLVRNRGIALSRDRLISEVWGYDFFGDDRTLDTHIKLLRRQLGPYADRITTLRGVGYRFEQE